VTVRLLLDEHFSPKIAAALRALGHDVMAVWDEPALRGVSDADLFAHAAMTGQRIVTENVRDFLPLAAAARAEGSPAAALLLLSPRRFDRGHGGFGSIVDALAAWLDGNPGGRPDEDWLTRPAMNGWPTWTPTQTTIATWQT